MIARVVAVFMRDGFDVVKRAGGKIAEGTAGGSLVLDDPEDRGFLESLYVGDIKNLSSREGQRVKTAWISNWLSFRGKRPYAKWI